MSEPIICERRTTCKLNTNGVCSLSSPLLDKRSAYTSCLDQTKPDETINP